MRSKLRHVATFACAVMAAAALTPGQAAAGADRPPPRIALASTPDRGLSSGGDVLLRITTAGQEDPVRVTVNGRAADGFERQSDGTLLGLVTDLKNGRNRITAESHGSTATRTVTNHRATGPIFSGQQAMPFYCETTAFGLAPAQQPHCSAPTKVTYK